MPNSTITKKAFAEAMKKLMREKPFAKINILDIVKECDLNRNSFYYHFKDKYDLVNWIFYTEMAQRVNQDQLEAEDGQVLIRKLCELFYEEKEFYINALSATGQNSFEEYFIGLLRSLIAVRTQDWVKDDEHRDFYIDFFADAFSHAILKWLKNGAAIPADEFVDLMNKATTGAALRIVNHEESL